jgi:hypothetical protein
MIAIGFVGFYLLGVFSYREKKSLYFILTFPFLYVCDIGFLFHWEDDSATIKKGKKKKRMIQPEIICFSCFVCLLIC